MTSAKIPAGVNHASRRWLSILCLTAFGLCGPRVWATTPDPSPQITAPPAVASPVLATPLLATPAPGPSGAPAAGAPTAPGEAPTDLKLIQDPTLRMTIPVMINGQGPFQFMIDTGADRTVISRELAKRLNLAPGPMVTMHQSVGVDQVATVVIDTLAVGTHQVSHIEAPALIAANIGADGMLGVDSLHDLHVVMDFETMRMSASRSHTEFSAFDGQTIVVHGRSRFGQLILVDAYVRGVKVFVVVDSGAQITVGNPALLHLLDGGHPPPTPDGEAQLLSVTGRTLVVPVNSVPEASIGGLIIRNMPLAFAQLHTFDRFGLVDQPALLLGMDILSKCKRVAVDLKQREATFVLN